MQFFPLGTISKASGEFFKSRSGQSTIEYMLVLCVVILIFLAYVGPKGLLMKSMNTTLLKIGNTIEDTSHSVYHDVYSEPGTCVCMDAACSNCP